MKSGTLALCAVTLLWTASISPSRADTYDVSVSLGGDAVGGYIDTTNGASGFLYPSELTDYDITIGSSQITPSNNIATFLSGTILWANAGALYLDFSQPGILDAQLSGVGDIESGTYWYNCGESIACYSSDTMAINSGSNSTDEEGHLVQIATEVVSTTPIPAALPLFAGGLGALGLLGRRRKRKNAAAIAA